MILYIENPKDATKNLLELINKVKLQDTYTNIQKSFAFLYTNNNISKRETKKKTHLYNR